jgi:hypothetical protein
MGLKNIIINRKDITKERIIMEKSEEEEGSKEVNFL